jgi:hypothetical protein
MLRRLAIACLLLLPDPGTKAQESDQASPGEAAPAPVFIAAWSPERSPPPYERAVAALFDAWEEKEGPIEPGPTGRVGLKVYTNSGNGLQTPRALVRAVSNALVERGFRRGDLFVTDLSTYRLRATGFLPSLSKGGDRFAGMPVLPLENPAHQSPRWIYESPLPPDPLLNPEETGSGEPQAEGEDRLSYLPLPLLFDLDFWINLPIAQAYPVIGINGATTNASLWSVSNQARFFSRPVGAASSAVEIAAIPELRRTYLFTLLPLTRTQWIGGRRFDSLYVHRQPELLLSSDLLALDRYALDLINEQRTAEGFAPVSPEPLLFRYGPTLDLGSPDLTPQRLLRLPLP